MGLDTMGKVLVTARVENLSDLHLAERGVLDSNDVRAVDIEEALVDTRATSLSLPKSLIDQLDLRPVRKRQARTPAGIVTVQTYGAVRLTVQGRDCICDVTGLPESCPVPIGQIPLESLDFVVDPGGQKLIGNPDHGGEQMIDLL